MVPRPAPHLVRAETRQEYGWRAVDHSPSLGKQLKGQALAKRRAVHRDQSRLACFYSRQTLASKTPNGQTSSMTVRGVSLPVLCVVCWTSNHDSKAHPGDHPAPCFQIQCEREGPLGIFQWRGTGEWDQSPATSKFNTPTFSIIINYLKLPTKSGVKKKSPRLIQKYKQNLSP